MWIAQFQTGQGWVQVRFFWNKQSETHIVRKSTLKLVEISSFDVDRVNIKQDTAT